MGAIRYLCVFAFETKTLMTVSENNAPDGQRYLDATSKYENISNCNYGSIFA